MRKKAVRIILSVLLIITSLLAILGGAWGGVEFYALKAMQKQLGEQNEPVDQLEEALGMLRDNEDKYLEGVELCYEGDEKLLQGRSIVDSGKQQLGEGRALMAQAQAEYDRAVAELETGKAQFAEAQAQLEAARPEYEEGKQQLQRVERLVPLLNTYVNFKNGTLVNLPGFNTLNEWYKAVVIPYIATLGLELPSDMDAFAAYVEEQTALGNEMLRQYEDAEVQLAEAQGVIDAAEVQLAEAKAQLDGKYGELNNAAGQISTAESQLVDAEKQLEEGKATLAEFEDGVKKVEEAVVMLLNTEDIVRRNGTVAVEGMRTRLGKDFDIYKTNEEGQVLSISGENPRLDYEACGRVCTVYREYVADYQKDLGREAGVRIVLDALISAAGVLGLMTAIKALALRKNTRRTAFITICALILCHVYGVATGYMSYVHPVEEQSFSGILPFLFLWLFTIFAVPHAILCRNAADVFTAVRRKKTKKPVKKQKKSSAARPVKKPAPPAPAPMPAPVVTASEPEPVISEPPKVSERQQLANARDEYAKAKERFEEIKKKYGQ